MNGAFPRDVGVLPSLALEITATGQKFNAINHRIGGPGATQYILITLW